MKKLFKYLNLLEIFLIVIVSLTLIFYIIFKAKYSTLTTDEAYTYLNYVVTKDFLNIGLANNHVLNTLLMIISNKFSNTVLFMRLPNLICGIAYIIIVARYSLNHNLKLIIYGFLVGSPFLIDFFTLARGYGISASLIFISYYIYYETNLNFKFQISIIFLTLSSLSINIYSIVLFIFILLNGRKELLANKFLSILTVLISVFYIYINTIWVFQITQPGKPLYGSEKIKIIELLQSFFNIIYLYDANNFLSYLILFLFYFLFLLNIYKKDKLVLNLILVLSAMFVLPSLFLRPYPYGRILIPLIPFVIFCLTQIKIHENLLIKTASLVIFIYLMLNLFNTFDFYSSIVWGKSLDVEKIVKTSNGMCDYLNNESVGGQKYVFEYYRNIREAELGINCF